MILRGIFTLRKRFALLSSHSSSTHSPCPSTSELRFFYQEGTSHLFPEAWYDSVQYRPTPES